MLCVQCTPYTIARSWSNSPELEHDENQVVELCQQQPTEGLVERFERKLTSVICPIVSHPSPTLQFSVVNL